MKKTLYCLLILNWLILSSTTNAQSPQGGINIGDDAILATVNGYPITLFSVLAETARAESKFSLMYSGKRLQDETKKIRKAAISNIIVRRLVSEKFDERGYKVPKQLIENMIDGIAADLAGGNRKLLETKARQAGFTMEDLKKQARARAATMMLINARCYSDVYITPKQVYDYYEKYKDAYMLPRKIRLQILYLKSTMDDGTGNIAQFAIRLQAKIANADEKTFSEFVARHSVGPNKDTGGHVGWIDINEIRPEFASALKGKEKDDVVGPVKTPEGFYFIRIADFEQKQEKSFNSVKASIKEKLEEGEKKKNYEKYIKKIKAGALIRYFM